MRGRVTPRRTQPEDETSPAARSQRLALGGLTVVLTGGGASLPMVQDLAVGQSRPQGCDIALVHKQAPLVPDFLEGSPLAVEYPQLGVALGGASPDLIDEEQALDALPGPADALWEIAPAPPASSAPPSSRPLSSGDGRDAAHSSGPASIAFHGAGSQSGTTTVSAQSSAATAPTGGKGTLTWGSERWSGPTWQWTRAWPHAPGP